MANFQEKLADGRYDVNLGGGTIFELRFWIFDFRLWGLVIGDSLGEIPYGSSIVRNVALPWLFPTSMHDIPL